MKHSIAYWSFQLNLTTWLLSHRTIYTAQTDKLPHWDPKYVRPNKIERKKRRKKTKTNHTCPRHQLSCTISGIIHLLSSFRGKSLQSKTVDWHKRKHTGQHRNREIEREWEIQTYTLHTVECILLCKETFCSLQCCTIVNISVAFILYTFSFISASVCTRLSHMIWMRAKCLNLLAIQPHL